MKESSYISSSTSVQSAPPQPRPPQQQPQSIADPKAQVTVANAARYVTAEMSLQLYGPVPDPIFEERKAQCMSCSSRKVSTTMHDDIGFCSSCGCGVNERSKLTVKLRMPKATCPMNKWGEADGRHDGIIDRIKSFIARKILG
jgi:hypothetical protein